MGAQESLPDDFVAEEKATWFLMMEGSPHVDSGWNVYRDMAVLQSAWTLWRDELKSVGRVGLYRTVQHFNPLSDKHRARELICGLIKGNEEEPFAYVRWVKHVPTREAPRGRFVVDLVSSSNLGTLDLVLDRVLEADANRVQSRILQVVGICSFSHLLCNDEHIAFHVFRSCWVSFRVSPNTHTPTTQLEASLGQWYNANYALTVSHRDVEIQCENPNRPRPKINKAASNFYNFGLYMNVLSGVDHLDWTHDMSQASDAERNAVARVFGANSEKDPWQVQARQSASQSIESIDDNTAVVLVLGPTGSGKSGIINTLLKQVCAETSSSPLSVTKDVRCYQASVNGARVQNQKIAFIDTIGLCDSDWSHDDVFFQIRGALERRKGLWIDCVLFCISGRMQRDHQTQLERFISWLKLKNSGRAVVVLTHMEGKEPQEKDLLIAQTNNDQPFAGMMQKIRFQTTPTEWEFVHSFLAVGFPKVNPEDMPAALRQQEMRRDRNTLLATLMAVCYPTEENEKQLGDRLHVNEESLLSSCAVL